MSRNSRGPRAGQTKDDADEERSIWNQLRADAKKVDALLVSFKTARREILCYLPSFYPDNQPLVGPR